MISHLHRCIFTHVPKTAGKAMLSAFGLPEFGKDYDGHLRHIVDPYGHLPLSLYCGRPEFRYFKFGFVRNPWDRLVSAFFYLDGGGCNAFDERIRADRLAGYGGVFSAFVRDLDRHLDIDHFRPQTHWLCDTRQRLLPDWIGRFETLDRDFAAVATRLLLPVRIPVVNQSAHNYYRDYFDRNTKEIAARIYSADIGFFGYEY